MKFGKLAIAFVLAGTVSFLMAQSADTAALTGTITDQTGAVVPNVTVVATNLANNQARTVTTGSDGVFRVPFLEPGNYRVRFTAQGFKTAEIGSVNLPVTETVALDRSLEVGSQTEQVTVEASVETIQTATSTLGTTVTGNTISSLPLSARNYTQVLGMSAGVAVDVGNGAALGRGSANMSVNGASPEKNNFQMDGVAINNSAGNNQSADNGLYTGITIPNPDSIQEFKIQTSTYDASFGRNPGANVNVVTKSGTNQIHGTLFEFFRNEALNANDFFYNRDNPASSLTKQVLKQNQYGGTVGGPIKKDKLFYFGSYQGTKQRNGIAAQGFGTALLYPIPGNREAADFSTRLGAAVCGFAPTRGMKIACDGSNINPVAIKILQVKLPDGSYYIPGSGTSGTALRSFSIPAKFSEDQYIANVDYVLSEKNSLGAKYMFSNDPFEYQLGGAFNQLPGRVQSDKRANTSAVLRLTTIVSNSLVNQARGSFQRIIQDGSDTVPYTPQQIGLKPLISSACCNGTTLGTYTQPPPMSFGGAFAIGGGLSPAFAPSNQTQWADQISWTKGTHTIRAGFEYENIRYPLHFNGLGRGWLFTPSFPDFLIGRAGCAPSNTSCSVANPGLDPNGYPTNGSTLSNFSLCQFCVRSVVQGIIHNYHLHNIDTFFQDDWKVSNRLTLNLGVRWEYDGVLSDKYGNLTNLWQNDLRSVPIPPSAPSTTNPNSFIGYVVPSNYDPAAHGPLNPGIRQFDGLFTSENGVPLNNFAPRIGFAWQPTGGGKLVVRGGVGLFYDRVGINRLIHAVQEGKPYADTTGIDNSIASLQSPYQDRPLAFAPRWFDFTRLTGSNFNSPFYDRIHTPLIRQYNLGIQHEFLSSYVAEVAYVGSSGINVADYNHNINTAVLASAARPVNGVITTNTTANVNARVPYLGFLTNGLQQNGFDGVYNYNSLQATVRKNFSKGFSFQSAYTYSKNLSDVGFDAANIGRSTDLWGQYGQTPYSRPHRFVLSYQYDLPLKAKGMLGKAVSGWNIAGLTTVQSGNPLTLFDNRLGTVYSAPAGSVEGGLSRANICPGFTYDQIETSGNVKDRLNAFFNKAAFTCALPAINPDGTATTSAACPTCGTEFGNAGIGIVRGPHQLNFDFQVGKLTRIGERQTIQLRAEFFNLFNHAQFAIPDYTIAPSNNFVNNGTLFASGALFGVINQTSVAPRLIQFGLKYTF